jgi:hypothetical protein
LENNSWGATARYSFRIEDDESMPVSGANVQVSFMMENSEWIKGQSDGRGIYSAEGQSRGEVRYHVNKEGFYSTSAHQGIQYHAGVLIKDGKWQPWDRMIPVVLRKIINPIPMYARNADVLIPAVDEPLGFDLVAGDWVKPAGKGEVADFIFRLSGEWRNYRENDSVLSLDFSNGADGIVSVDASSTYGNGQLSGSAFAMPRYAPEGGYINSRSWRRARKMTDNQGQDLIIDDLKNEKNYFFRVRSQTNSHGVVTNALYGKIHGNIEFVGAAENRDGSGIRYSYYLNPTANDRNMEFDPKRNLFTDLAPMEQVREP